jgi:cytochrome bd-type quinol oxidase subunit 1
MGLAWFIVYWKWRALRTGDENYNVAARFWAKIFGLNFAVGVVTGIPMEFQFGTNWADFSRYAGGVVGQTLAMEGMFAFFMESAFVSALIWGEKRLGPRVHFLTALLVATGKLALRLFHSRHQCIHAAPGGIPSRSGRHARRRKSQRLFISGGTSADLMDFTAGP